MGRGTPGPSGPRYARGVIGYHGTRRAALDPSKLGVIDRAITLFERGRTEEAAHLLAVVRRSAKDADEKARLEEIDDVIGQMRAHLSRHAREAFDRAVADESAGTEPHRALRPGELRSIAQSAGVVASVGAVAILVSALFRWPDTLLYALLIAVAGPLLIVILSLPIAFVNSFRPRMSRRREKRKQVAHPGTFVSSKTPNR
jgi:Flp pilus assembly protein TadB